MSPSSRVQIVSVSTTGSRLGTESRLPALTHVRRVPVPSVGAGASPEMLERVGRGRLASPLPYGVLSDYDRGEHDLTLPAVELSNGLVTATVLPTLGGRVWSLVDHAGGRELLFRNPRLRFANFGLTDAWFAGGIEWNLGFTGHATTSNRPVHTAVLDTPLGPVVRLWEWERTRDLVLQVDLWLDGPRLLASTRVLNPDPEPTPLYWWTNIAVPQTPGTRVLCPARHAWRTDYSGRLERVGFPFPDGPLDVSVPRASRYAADYFFEVADQSGRVVCAVEPDGHGFAQTGTDALRGRKLFLWGDSAGGRRWQDWLGEPGREYLEIQAGVCSTQLEHDLLDGHESLSWTEAFSALDLDPSVVGAEYDAAATAARESVHATTPPEWLEGRHADWLARAADLVPEELVQTGSGWGRAELLLRGQDGPAAVPFPEVDDDSAPFARLVAGDRAALDDLDPAAPPLPVVSPRWQAELERVEGEGHGGWWVPYALATGHHVRVEEDAARAAYERSVAVLPSAVALRGLALLVSDPVAQDELYARACALAPDDRRLAVERLVALLDTGRPQAVLDLVADLPAPVREHGRTRMVVARALAATGREDEALDSLVDVVVPDLAEGDTTLSDLWHRLRPGQPVPQALDFRMSVPDGEGSATPSP